MFPEYFSIKSDIKLTMQHPSNAGGITMLHIALRNEYNSKIVHVTTFSLAYKKFHKRCMQ